MVTLEMVGMVVVMMDGMVVVMMDANGVDKQDYNEVVMKKDTGVDKKEEPEFAGAAADDMMMAIATEGALGALGADDDDETFGGEFLSSSGALTARAIGRAPCAFIGVVGGGRRPVLGVPEGPYLEQASPAGLSAFSAQVRKLEAAGYVVQRVAALGEIDQINERHTRLIAGEVARQHAVWFLSLIHI